MRNPIETQAIKAIEDPSFETTRGYCQRFVRQVIQAVHGSRFDFFHRDTADASLQAWRKSEFAVDPSHGSIPGDILYFRETPHRRNGHVVVRVTGNKVAENSTVHNDPRTGGKGYRPLAALGTPDLIVRLPQPKQR